MQHIHEIHFTKSGYIIINRDGSGSTFAAKGGTFNFCSPTSDGACFIQGLKFNPIKDLGYKTEHAYYKWINAIHETIHLYVSEKLLDGGSVLLTDTPNEIQGNQLFYTLEEIMVTGAQQYFNTGKADEVACKILTMTYGKEKAKAFFEESHAFIADLIRQLDHRANFKAVNQEAWGYV